MSDYKDEYYSLLEHFLSGAMPVDVFQATFLERFKNERMVDGPRFELLDEIFGDVDSFTKDPHLLSQNPDFYLDEAGLREKLRRAASGLSNL